MLPIKLMSYLSAESLPIRLPSVGMVCLVFSMQFTKNGIVPTFLSREALEDSMVWYGMVWYGMVQYHISTIHKTHYHPPHHANIIIIP